MAQPYTRVFPGPLTRVATIRTAFLFQYLDKTLCLNQNLRSSLYDKANRQIDGALVVKMCG